MKKYLGIVLVGAMAAFGAGCSDDSSGDGGSGGGSGGSGGTGTPCSPENPNAIEISADITESTTWDRTDCDYILTTIVYVVTDLAATEPVVLTIDPGVTVKGDIGSALIVARGSQIDAAGTVDDPIVMTSSRPEGERNTGDWGGLALLGNAVLNRGIGTCGEGTDPFVVCEDNLEGLPAGEGQAIFGGDDNSWNCGTVTYTRIEFAGNEIAPNNELNGLTLGGCGSDTTLSYIQVHRGLDDGVEFFGGAANIDHVIMDGMGDDGLDWDQGYVGEVDSFIVHHYAGRTDDPRGVEADNFGTTTNLEPRSNPTVTNGTVVANPGADHDQGVVLRRGTYGLVSNLVVANFDSAAGIDFRDDAWVTGFPAELAVTDSCVFQNAPDFPTDVGCESDGEGGSTGEEDCNDWNTTGDVTVLTNYFMEDMELPGLNIAEDPGLQDYEVAATGGTPNYMTTNENCPGAFVPGAEDWTLGWTAYPVN